MSLIVKCRIKYAAFYVGWSYISTCYKYIRVEEEFGSTEKAGEANKRFYKIVAFVLLPFRL